MTANKAAIKRNETNWALGGEEGRLMGEKDEGERKREKLSCSKKLFGAGCTHVTGPPSTEASDLHSYLLLNQLGHNRFHYFRCKIEAHTVTGTQEEGQEEDTMKFSKSPRRCIEDASQ